jgi:hypothetical protein
VLKRLGLACAVAAAAIYAQRRCYADTTTYALSFDCSATEGVLRFVVFWEPAFFPVYVQRRLR